MTAYQSQVLFGNEKHTSAPSFRPELMAMSRELRDTFSNRANALNEEAGLHIAHGRYSEAAACLIQAADYALTLEGAKVLASRAIDCRREAQKARAH